MWFFYLGEAIPSRYNASEDVISPVAELRTAVPTDLELHTLAQRQHPIAPTLDLGGLSELRRMVGLAAFPYRRCESGTT